MTKIIGLDIGGTKCAVIESDAEGRIIQSISFPTMGVSETLENIYKTIEKIGPSADPAFGIACGSPQDSRRGIILAPPNLPDWQDVAIVDQLTGRFGGRGWLMNDANSCALAEWIYGAGRGSRHMLFMTFGTGLGGGLILNGRIYEGATGDAGELGHIRLAEEGPVGFGKSGSFEGFCSGGGIARMARDRAREREGRVAFNPGGSPETIDRITTRDVALAAEAGDELACGILSESGRRLGQGLAMIIDLLNLECIVIGSVFARCGKFLEPAMREVLEREVLPPSLRACRIVPAELGEDLGNYSAVSVALYNMEKLDHAAKA